MRTCSSTLFFLAFGACTPDVHSLVPLSSEALAGRFHVWAAEEKIVFAVYGDAGFGSEDQRRVAAAMHGVCKERGCHFAVSLGDNIYDDGVENVDDPLFQSAFEEPYGAFGDFDFWMVLGNHDWEGNAQAQIDYTLRSDRWLMPNSVYRVPGLPRWLNLVGFDSLTADSANVILRREQMTAMRGELCRRDGWKIIFGHHPSFASGWHGENRRVGAYLEELATQCPVHLYLAGHDHHQEHLATKPYVQVVQGAGGAVRGVDAGEETVFAREALGFAIVQVTAQKLEVLFYDVRGIIHQFSL